MVKRWTSFTCCATIQNSLDEVKRIHDNFELKAEMKNAIVTNNKSSSILIIKHLCIFLKKYFAKLFILQHMKVLLN